MRQVELVGHTDKLGGHVPCRPCYGYATVSELKTASYSYLHRSRVNWSIAEVKVHVKHMVKTD